MEVVYVSKKAETFYILECATVSLVKLVDVQLHQPLIYVT